MRYVQTLAERGEDVDVIALRRQGRPWRESEASVRVYQIQRRGTTEKRPWTYLLKTLWFWLKSMLLVTGLQMRRRYHVVHVHNVPDFLVFGAWLPKLMGARVILDIHDIVPELYAGKFNRTPSSVVFRLLTAIERACCSFADHVIISNDIWRDRLTSRSVPASKCTTILNYPDLNVFKPTRLEKGPAEAPFLILYPGSLNHHQGVDIAIRAFALVRKEMPGALFHIYGAGN
jgi:glycosyltransferase involved in cell wall biosynthesis